MRPIQLPDWGELWFIETERPKKYETPRMTMVNGQSVPVVVNGQVVMDGYKGRSTTMRDGSGGTEGDLLRFATEEQAQEYIDALPKAKAKAEPAAGEMAVDNKPLGRVTKTK